MRPDKRHRCPPSLPPPSSRYFSGRLTPHLLWFWYFTLWGIISIAENIGKKVFK